jgi:ribosomal protein S3AE
MRGKRAKLLRKLVYTNNQDLFNLVLEIYRGQVEKFNYKTMHRAAKKIWPQYKERIKKMKITKREEKANERNSFRTEQVQL